jgi:hypothetical protein
MSSVLDSRVFVVFSWSQVLCTYGNVHNNFGVNKATDDLTDFL